MHLWVEPAGGEQKSADIEQKTVTLIYPYPNNYSPKGFVVQVWNSVAGFEIFQLLYSLETWQQQPQR